MTVRQLLSSLDSRELSEWIAYFNIEKKADRNDQLTSDERIKAYLKGKMKK